MITNVKHLIFITYLRFFLFFKKKLAFFIKEEVPIPGKLEWIVWGTKSQDNCKIPKVIWTYWNGATSACAEASIASWKNKNRDFIVMVIDNDNLFEYLPELPHLPDNLPVQLVSDFIRLSLLQKYGGIWIDRSVIVTDSLLWILDAAEKNKSEMVCFYNEFSKKYRKNRERPIIENGFIAATKGSQFIKDWLINYQDCILSTNWADYYRKKDNYSDLAFNFIGIKNKNIGYFSCYLSAQQTMLESNQYRLFLVNAEDDYYFYYYKTTPPRNRIKFCEWILISEELSVKPKLIKLPQGHREAADECIRLGYFNRSSLLGKYL